MQVKEGLGDECFFVGYDITIQKSTGFCRLVFVLFGFGSGSGFGVLSLHREFFGEFEMCVIDGWGGVMF